MRLKSSIWISAYIRRCAQDHAPAMVVRRGEDAAGAIYIKVNRLDGLVAILAPAPQAIFTDHPESRRWMPLHKGQFIPETEADKLLEREKKFDPDIWIIEIEDRQGRDFLGDERIET